MRYHLQAAVAVLDPDTLTPVPDDGETIGEIMFRGNICMKGYLKNPHATDEGCSEAPRSEYGRSKLRGTRRIFEIAQEASLDVVVLRIFNAIGSDMSPASLLGRTLQTLTRARRDKHPARLTLFDIDETRLRESEVMARRVADTLGAHPSRAR